MNTNNRALFFLAQRVPWLLRPVLWLSIGRLARFPAGVSSIHAEGIRDWLGLMSVGDWRDRFHTSADGVRELLEFTRTRRGNLLSALLLEGSVRTSLSVQTSESKPLEVTLGRNVFDVAVLELRAEATGQRLELTGSAPANLVPATRWTLSSAWRRWRRRWNATGRRIFSTPIRAASSPASCSPGCWRRREYAARWTGAVVVWTTCSSNGCGAR